MYLSVLVVHSHSWATCDRWVEKNRRMIKIDAEAKIPWLWFPCMCQTSKNAGSCISLLSPTACFCLTLSVLVSPAWSTGFLLGMSSPQSLKWDFSEVSHGSFSGTWQGDLPLYFGNVSVCCNKAKIGKGTIKMTIMYDFPAVRIMLNWGPTVWDSTVLGNTWSQ